MKQVTQGSSRPGAGRTSEPSDVETHMTQSSTDPFQDDLDRTPVVLWVSVALMCVGFALVGGAVVALSADTGLAVGLAVAGVVLGLLGAGLGRRNRIMRNVD